MMCKYLLLQNEKNDMAKDMSNKCDYQYINKSSGVFVNIREIKTLIVSKQLTYILYTLVLCWEPTHIYF